MKIDEWAAVIVDVRVGGAYLDHMVGAQELERLLDYTVRVSRKAPLPGERNRFVANGQFDALQVALHKVVAMGEGSPE